MMIKAKPKYFAKSFILVYILYLFYSSAKKHINIYRMKFFLIKKFMCGNFCEIICCAALLGSLFDAGAGVAMRSGIKKRGGMLCKIENYD